MEVAYGESDTTEIQADDTAEDEPTEDTGNGILSILGNVIHSIVNTVTDIFKSLFRW